MNEQVKEYLDKYPSEIINMYNNLRNMIFDSVSCELEENLKTHDRLHKKYDFAKTQEILGQDMYEGIKILEEN